MNLSLRQLRAFDALARLRNFTRAAEHCHLTQSAFSALIANLEDGMKVRLFSRNTRHVELTADGEAFRHLAQRLLPDLEGALASMEDRVQGRQGRVAIAALPSISSGILPSLIGRFQVEHSGIEVLVQDVASTVCVDMVRSRQADFGLGAAISPSPELDIETLTTDTFFFVCAPDHPLASRRRLDVEDVIGHPLIVYEQNSSIRQHLDACIYPRQWHRSFEVNSLTTAAGFVRAGLGATIVPTLGLFPFLPHGLRVIALTLPIDERGICLIRRRGTADSVAASAFIDMLRQHIGEAVRQMAP